VWELLPWYTNDTLDEEECHDVEAHLATCSPCQAELAKCHSLAEARHEAAGVAWSPSPDRMSRLLSHIDAVEAHQVWPRRWWEQLCAWCIGEHSWWQRTPYPVRWALAAQGMLILALVSTIVWQSTLLPVSPYRTLADVSAPAPRERMQIRVVFADDMTTQEIRRLLSDVGGTIVKGPSPLGVYTVGVSAVGSPDRLGQVLDAVRAHQKVRLAESVAVQ
jgi:anti-sigma factor RsiW